jgi:hypothetical protein
MSKFKQVMDSIQQGLSFSWGFGGFGEPRATDLRDSCFANEEQKVAHHLQIFITRALFDSGRTISFIKEGEQIKIYY